MQILDTITDLPKHAINFGTRHLARHDHAEEIIWCVFHNLVVMAMITDDIDGLNDIGVFESRADTKLCGDFLLVFLLGLTIAFRPEFLDSKDVTAVLVAGLDEAHGTACTRAKDATPFAILLSEMSLRGLRKGIDGVLTRGGIDTRSA